MSMNEFDQIQTAFAAGGVDAALARLTDHLRQAQKFHELFEALKMQVRRKIGLPLLYSDSSDELSETQRTQLEDGLIGACREVGLALLGQGKIREGWMYLRPVGDKKAVAAEIAKIEADEENMEELVDVCMRESVDFARGFQLVLDNYGTCNAITAFESELARHPRSEQEQAARMLLRHLYHELVENLKTDIGRQEGAQPAETTLKDLVADRPWLFQEMTYHVDTTHLAAVTRFSRLLTDPESLRLALDITEYGRRLHPQFQYEGEPPFKDVYPTHALYFRAVLGDDVETALAHFREKAEACDVHQEGAAPIEVYIDLLTKLGRFDDAIDAAIRLTPNGSQGQGIAPTLIELCQRAGHYDRMVAHCREKQDLLGFTAALVRASR